MIDESNFAKALPIVLCRTAVHRFEQAIQVAIRDWGVDTKEPQFLRRLQLFQDCTNAQLLDPPFAGEVVRFAYLEAGFSSNPISKSSFNQIL